MHPHKEATSSHNVTSRCSLMLIILSPVGISPGVLMSVFLLSLQIVLQAQCCFWPALRLFCSVLIFQRWEA